MSKITGQIEDFTIGELTNKTQVAAMITTQNKNTIVAPLTGVLRYRFYVV